MEVNETNSFIGKHRWISRITKCSFVILFLLTTALLLIDLSEWITGVYLYTIGEFVFQSYTVYFFINVVIYLIWYQKNINRYSDRINSSNNNWSFMIWFIPVANIIIPYKIFKEIELKYTTSNEDFKIDFFVKIWAISFACWCVLNIVIFQTIPLFPEDIKMYYALNPDKKFVFESTPRVLELIGLIAMAKIVTCIDWIDRNKDLDILDHIIESP